MDAQVIRVGMLVCVPTDWTDEQVKSFVDQSKLCGTEHDRSVHNQDDKALAGSLERASCLCRAGYVHVTLAT